jgi:hypothetical protein
MLIARTFATATLPLLPAIWEPNTSDMRPAQQRRVRRNKRYPERLAAVRQSDQAGTARLPRVQRESRERYSQLIIETLG